jgi:hypothetical protein
MENTTITNKKIYSDYTEIFNALNGKAFEFISVESKCILASNLLLAKKMEEANQIATKMIEFQKKTFK